MALGQKGDPGALQRRGCCARGSGNLASLEVGKKRGEIRIKRNLKVATLPAFNSRMPSRFLKFNN